MEVVTIADIRLPSDEMYQILKMVAPGTPLREGLENVLRAKTGALIVVGDNPAVQAIADGGFRIDTEFSRPACMNWPKWTVPLSSARMPGVLSA